MHNLGILVPQDVQHGRCKFFQSIEGECPKICITLLTTINIQIQNSYSGRSLQKILYLKLFIHF